MIEPADCIATRRQNVHHVHVTSAMLSKPVNDRQNGPGRFLRPPVLAKKLDVAPAAEGAFLVFHGVDLSRGASRLAAAEQPAHH